MVMPWGEGARPRPKRNVDQIINVTVKHILAFHNALMSEMMFHRPASVSGSVWRSCLTPMFLSSTL